MKILYLTFYFEPDLCAGSFRNSPIVKGLSESLESDDRIQVITTLPNRYITYKVDAKEKQVYAENLIVNRIKVPLHKSDLVGQIKTFYKYFVSTVAITRNEEYDLVFASSSRLFTAFLGAYIARKNHTPLYLDIRDIFKETINDILKNRIVRLVLIPILTLIENYTFGYAKHINLVSEGFREYFTKYTQAKFTFYTNGIDDEFLNTKASVFHTRSKKVILYAGNLGEGQGLHTIVPEAAKLLGSNFIFKIIGDGGVKQKLIDEVRDQKLTNVEMINPVSRHELIKYYCEADFLFVHLNDYPAFKKVLPSKIFEYGAFDKPIVAGVGGYASKFIRENLENYILFEPGNAESMVSQIKNYQPKNYFRNDFIKKHSRESIVKNIIKSIYYTVK